MNFQINYATRQIDLSAHLLHYSLNVHLQPKLLFVFVVRVSYARSSARIFCQKENKT